MFSISVAVLFVIKIYSKSVHSLPKHRKLHVKTMHYWVAEKQRERCSTSIFATFLILQCWFFSVTDRNFFEMNAKI